MRNVRFGLTLVLACFIVLTILVSGGEAQQRTPSGAKAIFDSGEGSTVRMSSGGAAPAATAVAQAPKPEKFVGVSYKIALLKPNGDFTIVPKSHVFRGGDRVKLIVRTNRPGYVNIMNVGSSGRTHMLFNDYMEARTMYEIPRSGSFRFVGQPGTEKVLIMLSSNQIQFGQPAQQQVVQAPQAPVMQPPAAPPPPPTAGLPPPPSSGGALPPPPPPPPNATADAGGALPPPPPLMIASLEGAKDIVLEDNMKTSYAVVSPKSNWKPQVKGTKDIVLESVGGENYGVVPIAAIDDGGILTLEIKLSHR